MWKEWMPCLERSESIAGTVTSNPTRSVEGMSQELSSEERYCTALLMRSENAPSTELYLSKRSALRVFEIVSV